MFAHRHRARPPWLANRLLVWTTPKHHRDYVLGDLYEEFESRCETDHQHAHGWFWQQCLLSSKEYVKAHIQHPVVLQALLFCLATVLFFCVSLLVLWLSKMDSLEGFSQGFWHTLLEGNVHLALFEQAFWQGVPEYVRFTPNQGVLNTLAMFVNLPALLISSIFTCAMLWIAKNRELNSWFVFLSGVFLLTAPYLIGIIMLSTFDYKPTQVGPILAVMLLSFMYMVMPVSWLIGKHVRARQLRAYSSWHIT